MKVWFLLVSLAALGVFDIAAQTNPAPARLAIVVEDPAVAMVGDVLTAEFSKRHDLQLLERAEIERVYREQAMSAGNRDDLKIGRILDADGVLILNMEKTGRESSLTARLIAVKPGVTLTGVSFPWPLTNTAEWGASASAYFSAFVPKLTVLGEDAIPISVVNFRSAIQSSEGGEFERQLKLLIIQRLSRERQFFVLERQRMQLLSEENALKNTDDSAFWNGSYLLEGVVDQNGYSKEIVTINARLTPPKGGIPLPIEVNGSRTNISEVVNRLASKVIDALKLTPTVTQWSASDEAAQYYDEAKWALRWNDHPEAQMAADSAWVLGKKDLDCALARVRAYMLEAPSGLGRFQKGSMGFGSIRPSNMESVKASSMKEVRDKHVMVIFDIKGDTIDYVGLTNLPDPKCLDRASRALEIYYEFMRTSPDGKIFKKDAWRHSEWHDLGIQALVTASHVLQYFNFVPDSQKPVAGKLAELRGLARSIAEIISESPEIHDGYFVGDRIATYDELIEFHERTNIFSCEAEWGCFWQETPEQCVTLYRELMKSPVFCYIHQKFWYRELQSPRLIAWNQADAQRIPAVWDAFLHELDSSTNLLLQLEAKGLIASDAKNPEKAKAAREVWRSVVSSNRDELIANLVEPFYAMWGFDQGQEAFAMDQEYRNKTIPAWKLQQIFEKQKDYLRENQPYDFSRFSDLFGLRNYSTNQATQILPLVLSYKSKLVAKSTNATGPEKTRFNYALAHVNSLEKDLDHILNPQANTNAVTPPRVVAPKAPQEVIANILPVTNFLAFPTNQLALDKEIESRSDLQLYFRRCFEGKLWFDACYILYRFKFAKNVTSTEESTHWLSAVFDPRDGTWDMLEFPEPQSPAHSAHPEFSEICGSNLYIAGPSWLRRYDFKTRQWNTTNMPWQQQYAQPQLFAVMERLFAITGDTIFEIGDNGNNVKILASCRRRPLASALDSLETLWGSILFEGPNHSLCINVANKIYSWDEKDWHELLSLDASQPPEVFDDALVFRNLPVDPRKPLSLTLVDKARGSPQLCLNEMRPDPYKTPVHLPTFLPHAQPKPATPSVKPLWTSPEGEYLTDSISAICKSNIYLFVEHVATTYKAGQMVAVEKDGCHAKLACLSKDVPFPIVVGLRFDTARGPLPMNPLKRFMAPNLAFTPIKMLFLGDTLYIGHADILGIWRIPISELDSCMAAEKSRLLEKMAEKKSASQQ